MKLWMVGSNIIDLISNFRCTEDRQILLWKWKVAMQINHIATQNKICVAILIDISNKVASVAATGI